MRSTNTLLTLLTLLSLAGPASAASTLKVFPSAVELQGQEDRQSLVIQEVDDQGITRDVTTTAKLRIADPALATFAGQTLAPKKDGTTKIVIEHGKLTAEIPLVVKDAVKARSVSFRLDVMPVFMKHGCNNGSCHGAARGKDGFMLSLFGYDPAGDYFRLTRAIVGRRIDLAAPEKSMLLEKTIGAVAHTGGKLFDTTHDDYKTLLSWLKAGAPDDGADTPEPTGLELLPGKVVFAGKDQFQKTVVLAKYSDGSVRDVTRLSLYMTNNEGIAAINKDGVMKGGGRGGAYVFARFGKYTVGSEVIVLPTDDNFVWPKVAETNYVDTLVFDKLKKLHLAPSDVAADETFLRRVYLDLIGLPPTREEYDAFLADKDPKKRAKLIDSLIERPEFVDVWTMKWGELLRIRASNNQPQYGRDAKAMFSYAAWVKDQMAKNRPLNEFAAELLVGTGSNFRSPPSNLYTSTERLTPEKTAEDIAQVFLGTRIQCAQCHNHPFDRWTMDDYYGFTAFFAGVNLKRGVEGREVVVVNNNAANTVAHPVDNRRMKPKFLGGAGAVPEVEGQDPRKSLAVWLTAPDNAAFSQTMANIIWSHFFGRGIVEPVDDVRISNPPSNKELLEELGKKLASYGFDKKKLVRDICNSRTYQLSATPNATNELDEAYFSHSYVRRLRAEVLLDTITRVTGTEDRFNLSPAGTRAVQIHTGEVTNYFLTTFGRAPRETACSCEVNREANLSQALHLVNGDTITQKVAQSKLITGLLADKKTTEEVIEELYIRTLCRKPTPDEKKKLAEIVRRETTDPERLREMATLLLKPDANYARNEERLKVLKGELAKLPKGNKEAASVAKQLETLEQTQAATRKRMEGTAVVTVYGDILWGLFNSTEFTFNH
ncbi:MAG: cell surface protein [Planctomycetaceae bacterium]|nr:cell surface protein [Planctomycetaceae bacterium]